MATLWHRCCAKTLAINIRLQMTHSEIAPMGLADRKLTEMRKPLRSPWQQFSQFVQTTIRKLKLRWYRLRGGQVVNFLHIPKTGGSAVKNTIGKNLSSKKYQIHLRGHSCDLKEIPKGDKFFFFLRDPAQRFVSAFNHKKAGKQPWKHQKIHEETVALARFKTANHLASSLSSDCEETRQAAIAAMNCIEHVNTCYLDWFHSHEYFLSRLPDALYIGFQESLDQDFLALMDILQLPNVTHLPDRNSTAANKAPAELSTELTETAKENLKIWYADDYDFLRLCQEKAPHILAKYLPEPT